jgi:hypothetical protein
MATGIDERHAIGVETSRRLLLIWQNPLDQRLVRVGELDALVDGHFSFRYLPAAYDPDISPLVQFPDLEKVYGSNILTAFFQNRVMSSSRPSYVVFRRWIGLEVDGSDTPVEVLLRTGGPRATDTFHIVDDLSWSDDGHVVSRFLASGIRHVEGADARLRALEVGRQLKLRDEPSNPVNCRTVLIDVHGGDPVGYVPDWLVDDVLRLRSEAVDFTLVAERVNPEAPFHLRLLCRIEAVMPAIR